MAWTYGKARFPLQTLRKIRGLVDKFGAGQNLKSYKPGSFLYRMAVRLNKGQPPTRTMASQLYCFCRNHKLGIENANDPPVEINDTLEKASHYPYNVDALARRRLFFQQSPLSFSSGSTAFSTPNSSNSQQDSDTSVDIAENQTALMSLKKSNACVKHLSLKLQETEENLGTAYKDITDTITYCSKLLKETKEQKLIIEELKQDINKLKSENQQLMNRSNNEEGKSLNEMIATLQKQNEKLKKDSDKLQIARNGYEALKNFCPAFKTVVDCVKMFEGSDQ